MFPFQFTEEKIGSAEKTELDAHFENLIQRAEKTKVWTEKILRQTETLLQPNPSMLSYINVSIHYFSVKDKDYFSLI